MVSDQAATTAATVDEEEDLSASGPIAQRIRAELAAHSPLSDAAFSVGATADRGSGLFVAAKEGLAGGTYLFDYGGELLEQNEYDERYPKPLPGQGGGGGGKSADYAVGIARPDGSSVYVDAADPAASNLARFMNHAEDGNGEPGSANCAAWTLWEPSPRVLLFAARDIEEGEELVWDYGEQYWEGRGDKV